MLTKGDDYPIHQTAEPLAYAGTDRNFYDRYFFNGYSRHRDQFFAVALGVYPHLNVMDASFCVIHEGIQHNVHASRCLHMERLDTRVGPIAVDVVEPLRRLRIRVDDPESKIRAELEFEKRARVLQEPRFQRRVGPRTFFDYTRMTQHGTYSGWIEVKGDRIEVTPELFPGSRDRSWGVRPVGVSDPQPMAPPVVPQFYWLWAPVNFDDQALLFDVNQDEKGDVWHENAVLAPVGDGEPESLAGTCRLVFREGTRHARQATIDLRRRDGSSLEIVLEPRYQFFMKGLGYMNPEWGHGLYKGEDVRGYEAFELSGMDETALEHLHVQAVCNARLREGGREQEGVGVLEQLILGPHEPSGFHDLLDPAR